MFSLVHFGTKQNMDFGPLVAVGKHNFPFFSDNLEEIIQNYCCWNDLFYTGMD